MQGYVKVAGTEKTAGISYDLWKGVPMDEVQGDPNVGYATFEPFTNFNLSSPVSSNVGYYVGNSGAWKSYEDTSVSFTNTGTGGALSYLGTTTDNLEAAVQLIASPYIFASSAGKEMVFEAIISKETVAATGGVGWVCGLAKAASPGNSFMADAGADISDVDFVGFASFDATGDKIDFVFKKTSGSLVTVKAGILSPSAATFYKVGFRYNGSTIIPWISGAEDRDDKITAAVIAGTTFPNATQLSPVFGVKQAVNVAKYVKIRGLRVWQAPAAS